MDNKLEPMNIGCNELRSSGSNGLGNRCKRLCKSVQPHLLIIFIISVIGFAYHFNIALNQYLEYKTTVSFANEDPKDNKYQYPSATICFNDVVPYFQLIEEYPEYEWFVRNIQNEMIKRNDSAFWTNSQTKHLINITSIEGW